MNPKGYQAYKEQSVNTMTKGEMLILLYDEMLKRLARAEFSLEKNDYAVFDQSVKRCGEIVAYLVDTLNYDYPISTELKRMYDFFTYELSRLAAGRNPEIIHDLHSLVKDLRDAYSQASSNSHM